MKTINLTGEPFVIAGCKLRIAGLGGTRQDKLDLDGRRILNTQRRSAHAGHEDEVFKDHEAAVAVNPLQVAGYRF